MAHSRLYVPRKRPGVTPHLARTTLTCLGEGSVGEGDGLARFESALSDWLEGAEALALGSGRGALLVLLEALGINPGATILLAAYNASCVPVTLRAAGYRLFFVDIERDTLHLDPNALPDELPEGAAAIIVTHTEGSPMELTPISAWARERGLAIIEDAAHALGARMRGRPVGTLGDGAIFSLGRGKHLNALGGGLAVSSREDVKASFARRREALKCAPTKKVLSRVVEAAIVSTCSHPAVYGRLAMPWIRLGRRMGRDPVTQLFGDSKSIPDSVAPELVGRLSNLQARVGLDGLGLLRERLERSARNWEFLQRGLEGAIEMQRPVEGGEPAWLELTVRADDPDAFQCALLERGVDTQRAWMEACNTIEGLGTGQELACPVAREIASQAVYLPVYPTLERVQLEWILDSARRAIGVAS